MSTKKKSKKTAPAVPASNNGADSGSNGSNGDDPSGAAASPGRRIPGALVGAPLERVWLVHQRLSRRQRVTTEIMAEKVGVSARTILRDIEFMRDRLHMPVAWDPVAATYHYTRACDTLPIVIIGPEEALVLALVGRVCVEFLGVSLGRHLDAIIKHISPMLGDAVSLADESLDHVHVRTAATAVDEFKHFLLIHEAIKARRVLRMTAAEADGFDVIVATDQNLRYQ
jgi:predicted DNA-binding transcriptional regulator YafY